MTARAAIAFTPRLMPAPEAAAPIVRSGISHGMMADTLGNTKARQSGCTCLSERMNDGRG
jgi:hypothetical protein